MLRSYQGEFFSFEFWFPFDWPMTILFVLQRVESASLLIDNKDKYVDINKGIIIHISILKETKKEDLDKIGKPNLKIKKKLKLL
jgi:hypothetical protein